VSGPPVVVRRTTAADVDRIVEMYAEVADEGRWIGAEGPVDRDDLRQRWARRLEADDGVHLVAEVGPMIVGQVGVEIAPYGVASLGMMVDRRWRRQGVGTALVRAAVDAARGRGCHKVALQVWPHNQAARALYRRVGFEDEGVLRRHYRRGNGELWDAVVMGLVLEPGPDRPPAADGRATDGRASDGRAG
jgi:RimJ/RimL family protein N-acetyltransferase